MPPTRVTSSARPAQAKPSRTGRAAAAGVVVGAAVSGGGSARRPRAGAPMIFRRSAGRGGGGGRPVGRAAPVRSVARRAPSARPSRAPNLRSPTVAPHRPVGRGPSRVTPSQQARAAVARPKAFKLATTHHAPRRSAPARRRGTGLSPTGKTVSRAQQRLLFARFGKAAKKYTTRGRYKRLPERKRATA
jgi:hypothetical protein